jgi:hypothetical protein
MTDRSTPSCRTLWGVYHANGGLWGEAAYVFGKLIGTAHCALCDVTHGIRMKREWTDFVASLDVSVRVVHLNEQPELLAEVTDGRTPCVVEESEAGFRVLLGPEQLESAEGSVGRFAALLREAREAS